MASIHLSDDDFKRLTAHAQAAGFADVTAFISYLAGGPKGDKDSPAASDHAQQSRERLVALIQAGLAGETVPAEEAEARIRQKMQSIADRSK